MAGIKMTTYFLINLLKVTTIRVGRGKACPDDLNKFSKNGNNKDHQYRHDDHSNAHNGGRVDERGFDLFLQSF